MQHRGAPIILLLVVLFLNAIINPIPLVGTAQSAQTFLPELIDTAPFPHTCPICRQPLKHGDYYVADYWQNQYHAYHQNEFSQCYTCHRLIHPAICGQNVHAAGGKKFYDGRWVCNHCIRTGNLVFFPSDAQDILKKILERLNKLGLNIPNIYQVELVFDDQLAAIRKKKLRQGEKNPALTSLSLSRENWQNYTRYKTECTVYVLTGLHELFFIECLAHELTHVWIAVNCQYDLSPAMEEGLCNFVAYKILEMEPFSNYQQFFLKLMEHNPDPIYGEGFQKVRRLADEFANFNDLLTYIKFNPDFPK